MLIHNDQQGHIPQTGVHVDVALVHYPVVNRNGALIGSAVTNLDIHDIARAGRTYGINTYWLISPFPEQAELVQQIIGHWKKDGGYGGSAASDRAEALSLVELCSSIEDLLHMYEQKNGQKPLVVATCAKPQENTISYAALRERILDHEHVLLLFGTAWGLAPEAMAFANVTLPPICGRTDYNHLSVRSAASIIMDRLLSVSV